MAVDLEFLGNCKQRPSADKLASEVQDFVDTVQAARPGKAVFYVTPGFQRRYLTGTAAFPPHRVWQRNVFFLPRQTACERWTLWQFTARARVAGVSGPVDLNVFCGDQAQFAAFAASRDFR